MALSLLDTDMLSEVLRQNDPTVRAKANAYLRQYHQFAISSFTRYEVLRGLKQKKAAKQLQRFERVESLCCAHLRGFPN